MKKLFLGLALFTITSGIAFAATHFTDEGGFADWFQSSAIKMQNHGIMTGYPDGSFQAANNVTRAELAVMLDRFAEKVVGRKLQTEDAGCISPASTNLIPSFNLFVYDTNGNKISGATIKATGFNGVEYDIDEGQDFGVYYGANGATGNFLLQINKDGYINYFDTINVSTAFPCEQPFTISKTIFLVPQAI